MDFDELTESSNFLVSSVVIRVDSSYRLGTGHMSRCLRIARELRLKGTEVSFVCARLEGNSSDLALGAGFKVIWVEGEFDESNYPSIETPWSQSVQRRDAVFTAGVAQHSGAQTVLVDHYALGLEWEEEVGQFGLKVFAIDDIFGREHLAKRVFRPGLEVTLGSSVSDNLAEELTGYNYAVVSSEFCDVSRNRKTYPDLNLLKILVFFGGVDIDNATQQVVDALLSSKVRFSTIEIVVGSRNQFAAEIKSRYDRYSSVRVHDALPSLAPLMSQCDMAIGAGGVSGLERAAACLPSIVFSLSANQIELCKQMNTNGLAVYAGQFSDFNPEHFIRKFEDFVGSISSHRFSLVNSQGIVDCLGARRIAEVLSPSSQSEIRIRRAIKDDLYLYYRWVNDPLVRLQSINSGQVEIIDHRAWFLERVKSEETWLLVAEVNSLPIAQVRFEKIANQWELSYSLDELVRGRGWAVSIILKAIQWLHSAEGPVDLIARVKSANLISKKILIKCGFTYTNTAENPDVELLKLHA